jgi:phosphate transport system substrate-binding protein
MKRHLNTLAIFFISMAAGLLTFVSCNYGPSPSATEKGDTLRGKITISGAFALYPLTVRWAEEFEKLHPKVTVNVSAGGAGKGMTDALSKMVDLAMFSKEVSPEERAKGAWWIAVAKDAVLPTINSQNPVIGILERKGMTRQQFYDIFISGNLKTWGQITGTSVSTGINAFSRSDACGAADMWAKYLNGKKQEDLLGLGVNGDPGVADAVRKNTGGIGFNNLGFVYEMKSRKPYPGLSVVPIDLNNNGVIDPEEDFYMNMDEVIKAINDGRYPSPPARDLYFVSGGKPANPLVITFLKWILTDGQKLVFEAGYVNIKPEQVSADLQELN